MEKVRELLPLQGQKLYDDIVNQKVLGASKHVEMIGNMFVSMAEKAGEEKESAKKLKESIWSVADFFKKTRGEASCAVTNGIDEMLLAMDGIEKMGTEEAIHTVEDAVKICRENTMNNIRKITEYAIRLTSDMKKILVFDYSSTVNAFLAGLEGRDIQVFIPESRSINGGIEFARTAVKKGLKAHFIPDGAMMHFLKGCDGAFCGAETVFPDGTAFNTTGSEMAGLICREFKVPFYILTPMMKLDMRGLYGYHRKEVVNDLKKRFVSIGFTEEEMEFIDFSCPELLPIDKNYITGFITESGVIPADGMYGMAVEYQKKLGGR